MHHHVMDQNDRKEQRLVLLDSRAQVEIDKLKQQLAKSDKQGSSSKKRPQVLEEDEYTSRIEAIIERDFFPDVTKLKFELEYQDALEKNDFDKLQQLGKQKFELSQHSTVVHTPATFETPLQLSREIETEPTITLPSSNADKELTEKSVVKEMSLNKFLNKFTSEDNASFEQIQEESSRKHLEKMAFLSRDSELHNQRVENSLALPSMESQVLSKANQSNNESGDRLISWRYSNKNTVMFDPEGAALTKEETSKLRLTQTIDYKNTRLNLKPFNVISNKSSITAQAQNVLKHGKIGVDGKEMNLNITPNVNGFKFVPSTPNLASENLPDSPLMTWGEIECTPMNIRGDATPLSRPDQTPSTHFKMPTVPQREIFGQELANRILTKRKKEKAALQASSFKEGIYKSSLERLNSMSPAAQLLATKKLGLHNLDRSLQASYSPMMSPSRSQTPTPRQVITPSPVSKSTPGTSKKPSSLSGVSDISTHQSNISSLKRSKASEFF